MFGFFTQTLFKKDGGFDQSTRNYENMNKAEQAFHIAMSSVIDKPEYNKAIMYVYDETGEIKFRRVWKREDGE